jgi:glutamate racemase
VAAVVQPLLLENIDHIALGCTHYPFLSPLIRELTGEQIALYDPAEAIARRVDSLLQQHGSDSIGDRCYRFITTAPDTQPMASMLPLLIGHGHAVESLNLE